MQHLDQEEFVLRCEHLIKDIQGSFNPGQAIRALEVAITTVIMSSTTNYKDAESTLYRFYRNSKNILNNYKLHDPHRKRINMVSNKSEVVRISKDDNNDQG
jgi:hypothetical protein